MSATTQSSYQPEPLELPFELAEPPRFRVALIAEPSYSEGDGDPGLTQPQAVVSWLAPRIVAYPQEIMAAIAVDTRNQAIGWTECYRGTLSRAAVEPRLLLQFALGLNAAGIIIAHTHPSGDPTPSAEDIAFTRRLAEAGELVGVRLVDHLIIGSSDRWLSLKQRGAF